MAKTTKKKVSRTKTKKKIWYKVLSPKLFGNKEIGETYLSAIDKAVGRVFEVNLKDLTGNIKDQNNYVIFKVVRVDGTTLQTQAVGYNLASSFVKKMVRKNTSRLDDYNVFKTKDNQEVIVKSLIISRNRTQRSVRAILRKKIKEMLEEEVGKSSMDTFISDLVSYKIQGSLKKKLSKVYPLKEVAIRILKLKQEKLSPKETEAEEESLPAKVPAKTESKDKIKQATEEEQEEQENKQE